MLVFKQIKNRVFWFLITQSSFIFCFISLYASSVQAGIINIKLIENMHIDTFREYMRNHDISLSEGGVNQFTKGYMLTCNGYGMEMNGVKDATFIFHQDGMLVAIIYNISKKRMGSHPLTQGYNRALSYLKNHYQIVQKTGYKGNVHYTRLNANGQVIEIKAPKSSLTFQVSYLSKRFIREFNLYVKKHMPSQYVNK